MQYCTWALTLTKHLQLHGMLQMVNSPPLHNCRSLKWLSCMARPRRSVSSAGDGPIPHDDRISQGTATLLLLASMKARLH